ncbi:rhodanese-like domain-containing protein [Oleidesulfovibrio sp.]|uniref:rhodanese-like domain-containing protein n=1 Tax=Oleidesulfovibrio sp. TaxID=2909707 RepID=UPI003A84A53E
MTPVSTHKRPLLIDLLLFAFLAASMVFMQWYRYNAMPLNSEAVINLPAAEAALLLQEQPDIIPLDVRTPEEFAKGHLANAVLINFYDADFDEQLAKLDRNATYLLYCHSGGRSGHTLDKMQSMGFKTPVYHLQDGIVDWQRNQLPLQ